MFFLAFVNNDSPVAFYADEGIFETTGTSSVACGPSGPPDYQMIDEDCNGDGVKGDGVVVAKLTPTGGDRGPATVTVRQGMLELEEPYTIVGEARHISLNVVEPTIQTNAPDCVMFSAETIGGVLGSPERTVLIATVTDDDGTPITGALVAFKLDDPDKAIFALAPPKAPVTPSLDLQSLGLGAPNVLCGGEDPGKVTITAKLTSGTVELGVSLDGGAAAKTTKGEATVQDTPSEMVLTADPPSLVCDGINSSTVSVALTDSAGNPAVNGNHVHFDVKALGTADPINATTADGKATTTVKPLSGITGGVPVRATLMLPVYVPEEEKEPTATPETEPTPGPTPTPVGEVVFEPSTVEASLLIPCSETAPAAPAAPGAQPVPAIAPPATGDGGYLSDSQATSWGLPLALSAAVLFLVGGLALRRRAI
jgi:hypothetical protein